MLLEHLRLFKNGEIVAHAKNPAEAPHPAFGHPLPEGEGN